MQITEYLLPGGTDTDLSVIIFNFILCIIFSFILKSFYTRNSFSLTGKYHIGPILPILSSVVFLVILIVKSSLALSLGLVGALSIVRFRTPIKEPEELVYLFLAIALGLGYAANQTLITSFIFIFILLIIQFFLNSKHISDNEFNLVVKWRKPNINFEDIFSLIEPLTSSAKLIRLDKNSNSSTSVMMITLSEKSSFRKIEEKIIKLDDDFNITFFEAKTNW